MVGACTHELVRAYVHACVCVCLYVHVSMCGIRVCV